ncbi:MAG: hypothetical protein PIR53_00020 [Nocardioides alkalitolerans]
MKDVLVVIAAAFWTVVAGVAGYQLGGRGLPGLLVLLLVIVVGVGAALRLRLRERPVVRDLAGPAAAVMDALASAAAEREKVRERPAPGVLLVKTSMSTWSWGSVWRFEVLPGGADDGGASTRVVATIHRRGSVVAGVTELRKVHALLDVAEQCLEDGRVAGVERLD